MPPCSLRNVQRRLAHNVVWEWRERVLHTVQKRMKLLAALLFWEQGGLRTCQHTHTRLWCTVPTAAMFTGLANLSSRTFNAVVLKYCGSVGPHAGMKLRAWRGWRLRLAGWRAKHAKWELAVRHHRSRLQALCMGVLMAGWRAYQVSDSAHHCP